MDEIIQHFDSARNTASVRKHFQVGLTSNKTLNSVLASTTKDTIV
jgi:hypothetical protein